MSRVCAIDNINIENHHNIKPLYSLSNRIERIIVILLLNLSIGSAFSIKLFEIGWGELLFF